MTKDVEHFLKYLSAILDSSVEVLCLGVYSIVYWITYSFDNQFLEYCEVETLDRQVRTGESDGCLRKLKLYGVVGNPNSKQCCARFYYMKFICFKVKAIFFQDRVSL